MLGKVSYFTGLNDSICRDIMQRTVVRQYDKGAQIFLRGEASGEVPFYLILEGTVRIYVTSLRGREQVIRHFQPGETFAEVPLFDGGSYPANADAFTDVTLAILPRAQFLELMYRYPELAVGVVAVMADHLRHFARLVEDLSLRRVVSRVAHLLLSEQEEGLTQAEMAAMIGSSREMVNRSLHQLEDKGVIELTDDGRVTIRDREQLNQIVFEV
jgi:CRP/FNR family transcriptional regulator